MPLQDRTGRVRPAAFANANERTGAQGRVVSPREDRYESRMGRGCRGWLCFALVGCSSASEAAPATHDVVEVAVAAPPPNDAPAVPRAQKPALPASARASARPSAGLAREGRWLSGGIGAVPSAAVGSLGPPSKLGSADVKLLSTFGGKVDNAAPVVAGMAAGFRRCYRRGLPDAPNSAGRVQILTKIGPAGEVLSASPNATGSLSAAVVACLAARVSSAQFAPPSKTPATLTISVVLSP